MFIFRTRSGLYIGAAFLLGLGIISLTVFQLRFWLYGPKLDIDSRTFVARDGYVDVKFKVSNTKRLLFNGREIVPQMDGVVSQRVFVEHGNSIETIDMYDKYGGHKQDYLYITYPHIGIKTD